jgi:RHH-type rel operon transcriptional repressor/antitoxin RelB
MKIELDLKPELLKIIKEIAKENGVTVSQWIKNALEETLEDATDLMIAKNAMEEYERNPITYSLDEVISMQKGKSADAKK